METKIKLKKILIAFGTRPEAIKMVPLILSLQANKKFIVKVCVTGQHREMLDQVLNQFNINPDFDLNIMKPGQNLNLVTSNILIGMKEVFDKFLPNIVLVHGDTATTFAVSLAAYYEKVDIGHVEAGLRTGDMYSPWPEEGNRRLTSALAKYHFAPTINSKENLISEGISDSNIYITGNTVIDTLRLVLERNKNSETCNIALKNIDLSKKIILVTMHRRENFGLGFENICMALKEIAFEFPDTEIICPVHLNPNVREPVKRIIANINNIHLIEPLGYESFVELLSLSYFVLTDSGGIQEEAPGLGKPVLVMRDTTERPEAVIAGTVKLIGSDKSHIILNVKELLLDMTLYKKMSEANNPYGDGYAAQKILQILEQ
jgi:UDP-N-acetylglucosamine 2-epimerase (non-hydrolysing)